MSLPPEQYRTMEIPKLAVFKCPTCGRQAVDQVETTMLCQHCVNVFLAKNVGVMEQMPDQSAPIGIDGDGTG